MITGPDGMPISSDGRYIKIVEANVSDKKVWAVEYHPHISAFEFEEVFQVLGNVVAGIAQNARARKHEAMMQEKVKEKINAIKE